MSEALLRRHDNHVTRLTLNRPDKANALSAELVEALIDAVEYAATDGTRLLVLEGNGSHFCAGFDFGDLQAQSEGDLALRFIRIETLLQALHHAPYDTQVFAHGRVFGAGADIVACCSRRIAAPDTAFRMPGLRFGIVLGTRRLAERVGSDKARELLRTTRGFSADEALGCGFLTAVAARDQWPAMLAAAQAEAEALAPAAAAALNRRTLTDTRAEDMAELARSAATPGLKERIRRFREAGK